MLLGLLSDSHDNIAATQAALGVLRKHSPDAYLHAGDLVGPEMLLHFAKLPFHFVFGNNEWDHAQIRSHAKALSHHCHGNVAEFEFDGKKIAMAHGHEQGLLHSLITGGKYDYIIHGHTHTRRDDRVHKTRVINPGAIHRARPRSVALLDVPSDTVTFMDVPHGI